jgi:Holliday junction resolvase RusA-like endonuclease
MYYPITPVSAPRMTQADRWKKRPCVLRYFAFRDEVRLRKVSLNSYDHVTFHIPMPDSWSVKKKVAMDRKPHQQKPDIDNLYKALSDSLFDDDSHIHAIFIQKVWDYVGGITIESN